MTTEAVLEAWTECQPGGYVLEMSRLKELLPRIAEHVPGRPVLARGFTVEAVGMHDQVRTAPELFEPQGDSNPVFVDMLKEKRGRVQFLYFWKVDVRLDGP